MEFNKVSHKEIGRLNDVQLTGLIRSLLHIEACSNGIPQSAARVGFELKAPDGGEDGKIKWEGGPDKTDWLPCRHVVIQCKAQAMSSDACKREVRKRQSRDLNTMVESALDDGGAYLLCFTRHANPPGLVEREKKIREAIKEAGKPYHRSAKIKIYDASVLADWTNEHLSCIQFVRSCCEMNLPAGMIPWVKWHQFSKPLMTYFTGNELDRIITGIRCEISKPKAVVRILGLSCLGKTRSVLEAFRPPGKACPDPVQQWLSDNMVYCDASPGEDRLRDYLLNLESNDISGIVVIDNCTRKTHDNLSGIVRNAKPDLRLLTIDYTPEELRGDCPVFQLRPDITSVVVPHILCSMGFKKDDSDRIAEFAQGFPGMAILLAKDQLSGVPNVGCLNDAQLLEKLLWGRDAVRDSERRILRGCAILEYFGFDEDLKDDRQFVAREICDVSDDELYEVCVKFRDRGIFEMRGRFISVRPKPVALQLAVEWWSGCSPDRAGALLKKIKEEGKNLSEPLARQLAMLSFLPRARTMAEELCGDQSPFARAEILLSEEGSRVFRSIVKANPLATVRLLERALGNMSVEQLREVGPARRNLVWALEQLCFFPESFQDAAKLLFSFAVAENESISNNATGQLHQVFHLYLSGTMTPLSLRQQTLDELCSDLDEDSISVMIRTLGEALSTGPYHRTAGVEQLGLLQKEKDWRPQSHDEIADYFTFCLRKIQELSEWDPEAFSLCQTQVERRIEALLRYGIAEPVHAVVIWFADKMEGYWSRAHNSLLKVRKSITDRTVLKLLDELVAHLAPKTIEDQIRQIVSEPPWAMERKDDGSHKDVSGERAMEFGRELGRSIAELHDLLPQLLTNRQQQGFRFGQGIGQSVTDKRDFVHRCVDVLSHTPPSKVNLSVLSGALSTMADREFLSKTFDSMCKTPELLPHVLPLICSVPLEQPDLHRVAVLVRTGKISLTDLRCLQYGSVLAHFSPSVVGNFCMEVAKNGWEAEWHSLMLLHMYGFQSKQRMSGIETYLLRIMCAIKELSTSEILVGLNHFYYWEETVRYFFRKKARPKRSLAKHLASVIVTSCHHEDFYAIGDFHIANALRVLLERCPGVVWYVIGEGLLADNWNVVFNLAHYLKASNNTDLGDEKFHGLLPLVGVRRIQAWANAHPKRAPAALAGMVPVFAKKKGSVTWHPLARSLIEQFGNDGRVLEELDANLGNYSWAGSTRPYFETQRGMMQDLLHNPLPRVRRWAKQRIAYLDRKIRREKAFDAEFRGNIYPRRF